MRLPKSFWVPVITSILLLPHVHAEESLEDAAIEAPQSKAAYLDGKLRAAKAAWEKTLADRAAAAKAVAEKAAADKLAAERALSASVSTSIDSARVPASSR